jgi:hypothetical protein
MRFKREAPSPDHSLSQFLAKSDFSPSPISRQAGFLAKPESTLTVDDLCRQRNLANAASMHSSVALQPVPGSDTSH